MARNRLWISVVRVTEESPMPFLTLLRSACFGLLLVVFGVSLITFTISHLIPGDPADRQTASDALVAGIRHQLGLISPLYQQCCCRYVLDLRAGRPAPRSAPIVRCWKTLQALPATLELALRRVSAILVGVPLGVLSAVYHNRAIDQIARTLAVTGISTPAFCWAWAPSCCLRHLGCRSGGGACPV